jgi:hypothetical protein
MLDTFDTLAAFSVAFATACFTALNASDAPCAPG